MHSQDKRELDQLLAQLHPGERQKVYKHAAKLRKTQQREGASRGRRGPSLDDLVLHLLRQEAIPGADESSTAPGDTGRVITVATRRCTVRVADDDLECRLRPEIATRQQSLLAVGDQVIVSRHAGGASVEQVLPRRTHLSRPDPRHGHIERVIAANMDMVVVLASVKTPPFHPRLLDRYLLAIEQGGATPVILLNKMDLLLEEERAAELHKTRPYRDLGIPVIPCSAVTGEGLAEVRATLAGRCCVLVGHSGVGKSSLLNAIDPTLELRTNALRTGDGKGRHTTTASTLYTLADGITVIDTPGIREFGLWQMDAAALRWYFREFAEHAGGCKYADCSHTHEPDCAVKGAIRDGLIAPERYASYRRLLGEREDAVPRIPREEASFACAQCGRPVHREASGTAHRNHCPHCLWSLHVDDRPGDRAAGCRGLMEPVAVWVRKGGEWAIIHRCRECGALRSNRIAGDDNELLLMSLAVRPLSRPPFRLEALDALS